MKLNEPYLIINLNANKIIFFVISYNENKDYKLIKNVSIESKGIHNSKIVDVEIISQLIKKNINSIEDELDHYFSIASVIINPNNVNCLNISGYKKLNGSQVLKEDVAYILNDIKKIITSSEKKYYLVHLFNSSFSLDSDNLENLPIGLFGEFYNQNMTFFLVNKNSIRNIKLIFNNCGINIDRIILTPFAEGVNFLLMNKKNTNFTIISLENERVNISLFKNKSYIFTQDFNFGTDLVIKDISKLCSLKINEVELLLKKINLKLLLEENKESILNKNFFLSSPYRKIKHQFILDIISARLDELIEVCYETNSNLDYFRKGNKVFYITIEKFEYFKNFQYALEQNHLINTEFIFDKNTENVSLFSLNGTAELIGKGWDKEAIPVVQSRKSLISSFFSNLFS